MVADACTTISQAHCVLNLPDLTTSRLISMFWKGIIKACTSCAVKKATPISAVALSQFFLSWPKNFQLPWKNLRLKALALVSFCFMLHPSNAAFLRKSQIVFDNLNWFCKICLLGFKTNGQARGNSLYLFHFCAKTLPSSFFLDVFKSFQISDI